MKKRIIVIMIVGLLSTAVCGAVGTNAKKPLPPGFADISESIPSAEIQLAYLGTNNFVGCAIEGYVTNRGIISVAARHALQQVSKEIEPFGYHLYIFDAYRPQRSVNVFVRWAANIDDIATKEQYYPDIDKDRLIPELYIADQSSHSRGSTVDLTIAYRDDEGKTQLLDMGSPFDFFGSISWPSSKQVTPQQRANRTLLRTLMMHHGFVPYEQEWWHFTLKNEPFPATWFDFPVQ